MSRDIPLTTYSPPLPSSRSNHESGQAIAGWLNRTANTSQVTHRRMPLVGPERELDLGNQEAVDITVHKADDIRLFTEL